MNHFDLVEFRDCIWHSFSEIITIAHFHFCKKGECYSALKLLLYTNELSLVWYSTTMISEITDHCFFMSMLLNHVFHLSRTKIITYRMVISLKVVWYFSCLEFWSNSIYYCWIRLKPVKKLVISWHFEHVRMWLLSVWRQVSSIPYETTSYVKSILLILMWVISFRS